MANMFKSVLAVGGSGGSGADLIVTCSAGFAGSTITCTDGTVTFTETCPSSSPYEVVFQSIPTGTWTISGVVSGQTFSTTKTITDFDATLIAIPDGSTVTPTDNIQTWLYCAGIFDKNYTTISQVLADASTVQALVASDNAVDYMVRSTTWSSDVTANSSAMTYIGLDDYCSDALLSDNTWIDAICNSAYFESVLNVKIPTMTSATAPSGVVSSSSTDQSDPTGHAAYKAFDKSTSTDWISHQPPSLPEYVGYAFDSSINVKKLVGTFGYDRNLTIKFQGTNDNSWVDLSDGLTVPTGNRQVVTSIKYDNNKYSKYRVSITAARSEGSTYGVDCTEFQVYGRA